MMKIKIDKPLLLDHRQINSVNSILMLSLTCDILRNFSVTSDAQDVEVCININAFLIRCIYITGSTIVGVTTL